MTKAQCSKIMCEKKTLQIQGKTDGFECTRKEKVHWWNFKLLNERNS